MAATNSFLRYDLSDTFDVIVGQADLDQQRFTLHTDVFTKRSEFFRVARSPEWLVDPSKPVDLQDDDPEVFSAYMNCAYFGIEILGGNDWPPPEDDDSMVDKEFEDAFRFSQKECESREACGCDSWSFVSLHLQLHGTFPPPSKSILASG